MTENTSTNDLTDSNIRLTERINHSWRERSKACLKGIKNFSKEITVEPCVFVYYFCLTLSSLTVQNMHLEKSCRVNYQFSDEICDRIRDRNTTGLEYELNQVQRLVAKVLAWKFPLQSAIPAVMILFLGAWSDKSRKRKIFIVSPIFGEILVNIGLLLSTYFFYDLSLFGTALLEALPSALFGSFIIMFLGFYSFLTDRTSVADRTYRLGLAGMCISLGGPLGTALSGVMLRALGYYGMFSLILGLHTINFLYGLFRLKDICVVKEPNSSEYKGKIVVFKKIREVFVLVVNTVLVIIKPRPFMGRIQIFLLLALYLIIVGPNFGKYFSLLRVLLLFDTPSKKRRSEMFIDSINTEINTKTIQYKEYLLHTRINT